MPEKPKAIRKLSAILSADVKGYSRLMEQDEASTIQKLKEYRHTMSEFIQHHSGRVVDAVGDNLLAEFSSAVHAVQCAVGIQNALKENNADLPDDKRLMFRIGINIGDVIQDGDNLYGEGVNIASRIEGLSDPGGVCISRGVYDHIRNKLELGYEYLGEHGVKNIKHPVRVYKVLTSQEDVGRLIGEKPKSPAVKWIFSTIAVTAIALALVSYLFYQKLSVPEFEPASIEKMAFSLPAKPSIVVLPFDNLGNDPKQEYLADAISENITAALSRFDLLFVISYQSAMVYKNKEKTIKQISEELGVRYLLGGSVQKVDDQVRIKVRLIDAISGEHIWDEKFDRNVSNIFAIQDEVTKMVASRMSGKVVSESTKVVLKKFPAGFKAWDYFLKARLHHNRYKKEDNLRARELYKKALILDSNLSEAYAMLGWTYFQDWRNGWQRSGVNSLEMAERYAKKAEALYEDNATAQRLYGNIALARKNYDTALAYMDRALELNPNYINNIIMYGTILIGLGRSEESLLWFEKAIRLNPHYPSYWDQWIAYAYFLNHQYNKAIDTLVLKKNLNPGTHRVLAASYGHLGEVDKAQKHIKELLKADPQMTISKIRIMASKLSNDKTDIDHYMEGLKKAGLPEKPPLQLPDKPSIAVLPFDSLSDDPEQGYLSDGLTDELIGDLAKIKDIFVISRNSAFTYKGKTIKIKQVAKDLNVRYVLEGSVQRAGNRLRIRAQLIDAKTDHHVWAESYDGDGTMDNIFELQDEVTRKIVAALAVQLTDDQKEKISDKGTDNVAAYDAYLKALAHYVKFTPESVLKSVDSYEQAIKIDPNFHRAYAGLAHSYWVLKTDSFAKPLKFGLLEQFTFSLKARHYLDIAMKNPTWEAYRLSAYFDIYRRNYGNALNAIEKAYSIAPNEDLVNSTMGFCLIYSGNPEEALNYLNQAMKIGPQILDFTLYLIGLAHFTTGNYREAISSCEKAISINSGMKEYYFILAASYALSGKEGEAIATLKEYFEKFEGYASNYSSSGFLYYALPYKDHKNFETLLKGLKNAGLDEYFFQYHKIEKANKLNGGEIKNLVQGKKFIDKYGFTISSYNDGNVEIRPFGEDSSVVENGKFWITDNTGCMQADKLYDGFKICSDFYKTSENGNKEYNYLYINDHFIIPFNIHELE